MIIPSTDVLMLAAAILMAFMTLQWFVGGMSLRHRAQKPQNRPLKNGVEFNQAA